MTVVLSPWAAFMRVPRYPSEIRCNLKVFLTWKAHPLHPKFQLAVLLTDAFAYALQVSIGPEALTLSL